MFKTPPHWLVPVFAALGPSIIALSSSLPATYQGPCSTLGIACLGLAGMVMPTPTWAVNAHPIIPTSLAGIAVVADGFLKQQADAASGPLKVGLYAAACLLAWAAGLHAPSPVAQNVAAAAKALVIGLALLLVGRSAPARAGGFDWSAGPSFQFLQFDLKSKGPGVQVANGAGLQVSVTHDVLKREFLGKSWDLADLILQGFGSRITNDAGDQFGQLSAAIGACTMSSIICLTFGKHLWDTSGTFQGSPFIGVALNFNFALAPQAPPTGVEQGPAGLVRGNTLFFGSP